MRALTEVSERRKRASTYTEPLTKSSDMKDFLQTFYKNIYKQEKKEWYRAERAKYISLAKNYDELCGKTVSYEDFWMRYERRCDLDRVMQELTDKDAAQVEQTKTMVSDFVNKAWGTPTKEPEKDDKGNIQKETRTGGTSTKKVVEQDITTNKRTPVQQTAAPSSPQASFRNSISKVLGTSNWSAPSPMTGPSSHTPKEASQKTTEKVTETKFSSNDKTELHGVKKTQEQNSILSELKKNILGTPKSAKKETPKRKPVESSKAKSLPCATAASMPTTTADTIYDNNMADTAAMLLFLT
ncbi:MAG: hypothetical protein SGARI_000134 [Bacillariaceae sp.]